MNKMMNSEHQLKALLCGFLGFVAVLTWEILPASSLAEGGPQSSLVNPQLRIDNPQGRNPDKELSCTTGAHSAVEHCTMNGIDVIRVNLNDPTIGIIPVI